MTRLFQLPVLLFLTVILFLAGCGQSASNQSGGVTENKTFSSGNGEEKVKSEGAQSKKQNWPKGISISSAPLGGTFHVYATGWGELISKKLGISVNVEATGGPIQNIQLVNSGNSDVGMVTMGPAYEAYKGIGWADKKYENIRTIFPMYTSYLHWFAMPQASVKSLSDMNGKVVGTGAKGGTPDYYTAKVFEDLGIKPKRIINGSFSDYANQMRDGQMDVFGVFAPAGHPTGTEMIKTEKANVIGVGEKSKELAQKYGITAGFLKANSYQGQTEDIETLTIWSAFTVKKDLPEDFVYELVKVTFEGKDDLQKVIKEAAELNAENAPEALSSVPMHPGAIRYYEEKGLKLPDSAYPPEYKK